MNVQCFEFTNQAHAELISRVLYELFSPRIDVVTSHLFTWEPHPSNGKTLIVVNADEEFKNYNWPDLPALLSELKTALENEVSPEELFQKAELFRNSDRINIGDIIPNELQLKALNLDEAKALGYFAPEV